MAGGLLGAKKIPDLAEIYYIPVATLRRKSEEQCECEEKRVARTRTVPRSFFLSSVYPSVISIFSTGLAESGNRANVSRLSSRDPCVNQGDRTIPAENYEKQAEVYKKLFEIFMRHEDVIDRVTFWGLSDTRAWRRNQHPLLFDGELNPKPAYKAVIEASMTK